MTATYALAIRAIPMFLLVVALVNFLGAVTLMMSGGWQQGLLFSLSAALGTTLVPLIAASVLLRFDQWFASGSRETFE